VCVCVCARGCEVHVLRNVCHVTARWFSDRGMWSKRFCCASYQPQTGTEQCALFVVGTHTNIHHFRAKSTFVEPNGGYVVSVIEQWTRKEWDQLIELPAFVLECRVLLGLYTVLQNCIHPEQISCVEQSDCYRYTVMRRVKTFQSTKDRIYGGGLIYAGPLVRSQCSGAPATGHLDTGFSSVSLCL